MPKPETNYLIRGFRAEMQRALTPRLADPLYNSALAQLRALLAENRNAEGKVPPLLEKHILPAVAAYRAMCTAVPQEQALAVIQRLVTARAAGESTPASSCSCSDLLASKHSRVRWGLPLLSIPNR